jgi:hypothetical protein
MAQDTYEGLLTGQQQRQDDVERCKEKRWRRCALDYLVSTLQARACSITPEPEWFWFGSGVQDRVMKTGSMRFVSHSRIHGLLIAADIADSRKQIHVHMEEGVEFSNVQVCLLM